MRKIRVGSRDSKLAVIQAQMVIDNIKAYDSSIQTELVLMKTTGDKILDKTLDKIGGKGLFVKELDEALLNNLVDITVHSCKDLPMELNPALPIVALSDREDERDVLILPLPNTDVYQAKPLGCSSKRRSIQLNRLGYEQIIPLRGNVITRLNKLDNGEYSAIVLAAAGIKRLGLQDRISRYFTTQDILPAACQGIIAVQARAGEDTSFLKGFHSEVSATLAAAERAFVATLDGGCSSPIAAYARVQGKQLLLEGMYADECGSILRKGSISGSLDQAKQLGVALAQQLRGGEEV